MKVKASTYRKWVAKRRANSHQKGQKRQCQPRGCGCGCGNEHKKNNYRNRRSQGSTRSWR